MFYERSGYHLFTLGRIDVFISLWYLLIMGMIVFMPGLGGGGQASLAMAQGVLWVAAITVSLLVHEFGHAVVSKIYDLKPSILLHGFGGLCMHEPADTDGKDALILLAGPGAGLALGAASWAVMTNVQLGQAGSTFMWALTFVSLFWNLVNLLLPIYPLDGGKLFHLLLRRVMSEQNAQNVALRISVVTAVLAGIAFFSYFYFSLFVAIMLFFIVSDNLRMIQSNRSMVARSANSGQPDDYHVDMLDEIRQAMEAEDYDEAYRLCHQLRSTGGSLTEEVLDEVWTFLAISSAEIGRCDEADSYIKRAPETAEVQAAREKCRQRSSESTT